MSIEEKRRELFEAVFPVPRGVVWREAYHLENVKQCTLQSHLFYLGRWQAFNAALDAVVIELPQQWNDDGCGAFYREDGGPHMDAKEVIAAIESTGLGLKVLP